MFELQAAIIQKFCLFFFVCMLVFFCVAVACLLVLSLDPLRVPRVLIGLGVVKVRAHIFLAILVCFIVTDCLRLHIASAVCLFD